MVDVNIKWIGKGKVKAQIEAGSLDPEGMIRDAANTGIRIARLGVRAIDEVLVPFNPADSLKRWNKDHRRAFRLFFGLHKNPILTMPGTGIPGHINVVADRLHTLLRRLEKGITIKVRPASGVGSSFCKDGGSAFQASGPLGARKMNLCPKWFGISSSTKRATILLHEMFHAMGSLGFTTDQKNQFGNTVRGDALARRLAEDRPLKARRNPENYEEFFNYLIRTTSTIGQTGWTGIRPGMDAALVHPNGKAYFFYGSSYLRYDFDKKKMDKEGQVGRSGWPGLRPPFDAAILHPNGKAYFFKGRKYQRFDFALEKKDKTGTIGQSGWKGLVPNIDAALVSPNSGKAHFFSTIYYHRFDFGLDQRDRHAVTGDPGWKGLYGRFDAALVHPRNNKAYFFVGDNYFRWDFSKSKVDNVITIS